MSETATEERTDYLVWSEQHRAWWAPDECGYRSNILHAGLYTESQAKEIERRANLHGYHERAVPIAEKADELRAIVASASRMLAAIGEADNTAEIERLRADAGRLDAMLRYLRYHLKGRYDTELVKMINDVMPPDEDDTTGGASGE